MQLRRTNRDSLAILTPSRSGGLGEQAVLRETETQNPGRASAQGSGPRFAIIRVEFNDITCTWAEQFGNLAEQLGNLVEDRDLGPPGACQQTTGHTIRLA